MAAQLAGVGMVKCLAFSGSGRLLALGGDDGSLTVLDWPALRVRAELRCALLSTSVGHVLLLSTPGSGAVCVPTFVGSPRCGTSA